MDSESTFNFGYFLEGFIFDFFSVVTGLRFRKQHKIMFLQIQVGKLMPNNMIERSTVHWQPLHSDVKESDIIELDYDKRTMLFPKMLLSKSSNFVLTGVSIKCGGTNCDYIIPNIIGREYNPSTGVIAMSKPLVQSYDKIDIESYKKSSKIVEIQGKIPLLNSADTLQITESNFYLSFDKSNVEVDAAQSTVPYFDIQDIVNDPPTPLKGIEFLHYTTKDYAGFVQPQTIRIDKV